MKLFCVNNDGFVFFAVQVCGKEVLSIHNPTRVFQQQLNPQFNIVPMLRWIDCIVHHFAVVGSFIKISYRRSHFTQLKVLKLISNLPLYMVKDELTLSLKT